MKRKYEVFIENSKRLKLRKSFSLPTPFTINDVCNQLHFDLMPLEIKHRIFSYLEISELHNICKISRSFNILVQCYISSQSCLQTQCFHKPHAESKVDNNSMRQIYQSIGKLYKAIYEDCSFMVNLNFLSTTLQQHVCFPIENSGKDDFDCGAGSIMKCNNYPTCHSMTNYGYFLREFVSDWNDNQNRRLFQTLLQFCFNSNFWKKFTRLLFKYPGTDVEEELIVRLFLRRIFLSTDCNIEPLEDAWNTGKDEIISCNSVYVNQEEINQYERAKRINQKNSAMNDELEPYSMPKKTNPLKNTSYRLTFIWLNEIIKSYHIGHQAKILFILYGPLHKNKLMWNAMCENTAADASQVSACFGELGWTLRLLQTENYWSEFKTISTLGEMTNLPDEWLAENIACLLYTSGYVIASQYVAHKSLIGHASEVAITLTSMCLVQVKLGTNFRNVLALVDKACSSAASKKDKRYLLDKLAVSFQDVIVDLYETDEIDNRLEDFSTLLKAQANFVRAIFKRMYEE